MKNITIHFNAIYDFVNNRTKISKLACKLIFVKMQKEHSVFFFHVVER